MCTARGLHCLCHLWITTSYVTCNSLAAVDNIWTGPSEAEVLKQPLYMHIAHYKQLCCIIFVKVSPINIPAVPTAAQKTAEQSRTNGAQKWTYHGYHNRINAWMEQMCCCAPFNSSARLNVVVLQQHSPFSLPPSLSLSSLSVPSPIADLSHCRGTTGVCGSCSPPMTQHTFDCAGCVDKSVTVMISHWFNVCECLLVHYWSPLECHLLVWVSHSL